MILSESAVKVQKRENEDFENTLYWFCKGSIFSLNVESSINIDEHQILPDAWKLNEISNY